MIQYDQQESARIHNKNSNLSTKASDLQRSAQSSDLQTRKQGAMPAKGRRQTLVTTLHHNMIVHFEVIC